MNYDPRLPEVFQHAQSTTPLAGAATFTSNSESLIGFSSLVVACKTDADGTLYVDFSTDRVNWDSTITYNVSSGVNEVHRLVVTRPYFRVRYVNGSVAQSYMRLSTMGDDFNILSAPLNATIQQDQDTIVTRNISEELSISEGKFTGYSIVNKFGYNSDIDTGTTPEDIWLRGGAYTGWATVAETVTIVSSSANDTSAGTGARTVQITGLDADYNVQSETITLNGTGTATGLLNFIRVHTARVVTAGSGGVNAGVLTIRQTTTSANIFLSMQIGRNQTNCSAYTVPAGYTAYMRQLHVACGTSTNVSVEGTIWTRTFGSVFRSRRPFFASNNFRLSDSIYGGLVFTEKSDIIIRINSVSANNTPVNAGYDLILVKN